MKRSLLFLLAILFCAQFSFGQGATVAGNPVVVNGVGQPMGGVTVAICNTNPGANPSSLCNGALLATLYTDITLSTPCSGTLQALNNQANPSTGSACSNPGLTDGQGNVVAFAVAGIYWCEYSGSNIIGIAVTACTFPSTSVSGALPNPANFPGGATFGGPIAVPPPLTISGGQSGVQFTPDNPCLLASGSSFDQLCDLLGDLVWNPSSTINQKILTVRYFGPGDTLAPGTIIANSDKGDFAPVPNALLDPSSGILTDPAAIFSVPADTTHTNAYVVCPTGVASPQTLFPGETIYFTVTHSNNAASTFNWCGSGVNSIVKNGVAALVSGDIPANYPVLLTWSGINWVDQNPASVANGTLAGLVLAQDVVATGSTTVTSKPRACDASVQAGADICAQINACYLAAATTNKSVGEIDARGYPIGSVQACNSNPFNGASKSGILRLGAYTIATSATWITPQQKFRIIGEGGTSPLGNNGNSVAPANTIIQPCLANGSPTGCTAAFQQTSNKLFVEASYNLLASASCTESGTTATCTTTANHNYTCSGTFSRVVVAGVSVGGYNGTFTLTGCTATTFSYTTAGSLGTGNGGTVTSPQRQHGPYSATGSGLTGPGNYYALIAMGGNQGSTGYDGNGTCGSGPVGADWSLSAFGSTIENLAFDNQGLAGVGSVYSGNIQERGGLKEVSFNDYGGGTTGPQTEGFGFMWDRNAYNLNDKCSNASGNGGPSHFTIQNIYCDASPAVASGGQGICGVLAGNHTELDGQGSGGLAQYGIQCPGTIRGLNGGGTQKSNYGFWIENYDDGSVDDCHFENINKDPIYLHGTNGWTSQGWLFMRNDFASSSGANNAVVHLDVGTNNNTVLMVRGSSGANPAGVRDEVFGCGPAFGAAPPCIVNGTTGGNPVTTYVQGGMNVFNNIQIGNVANPPIFATGTGAPSGACINSSFWGRTDGTGASDYVCQNLLYYPRTITVGTGTSTSNGTAVNAGVSQAQPAITVTGATTSDTAICSLNASPVATWQTGIQLLPPVVTANTVTPWLSNPTAGNITPAASVIRCTVTR